MGISPVQFLRTGRSVAALADLVAEHGRGAVPDTAGVLDELDAMTDDEASRALTLELRREAER